MKFKVTYTNPFAIDGRDDIQRTIIEAKDEAEARDIFAEVEVIDVTPAEIANDTNWLGNPEPAEVKAAADEICETYEMRFMNRKMSVITADQCPNYTGRVRASSNTALQPYVVGTARHAITDNHEV